MPFSALPVTAAWQHRDARLGFEVAWFQPAGRGFHLSGCTTGAEDGQTWVISYAIELDETWTTRSARITGQSASGIRHARLKADGHGRWRVDGQAASHLDGCLDVDLESSAMTNALPVHRMGLRAGDRASAPAAYVRAPDLRIERLEENIGAASVELTSGDLRDIENAASTITLKGARYAEAQERMIDR